MTTFSGKSTYPPEGLISNQPFWPELNLQDFVVNYRVPNDMNVKTVREHLIQAMTDINLRLSEFRSEYTEMDVVDLANVPAEAIDGESILVILYRRAVFCRAKASICRDFPTIDRREPADNQAKSAPETEAVYLRFADEAIRQMLNLSDITVELI
ncbi:head completion/stabilization protein [Endozoicomonas sp. SCSIO W0465]|uniref:head completion/stabilization protein n=1 Tax=Endozoicomonas sp. SCSIO W0465 TaxID=2918516 RepID=UPI00207502A7|nr:head completion/stabilization protein [Endozoicomonas sp. SCSIO W0465]USE39134.1 head completion/stabilization protein [Endozoicomonas sp. SCSIO W0465]